MAGLALMHISSLNTGHKKVSREAYLSLPQEMSEFFSWTEYITAHASDADERKFWDSIEGVNHYIDIHYNQQFIFTGTNIQSLDSISLTLWKDTK